MVGCKGPLARKVFSQGENEIQKNHTDVVAESRIEETYLQKIKISCMLHCINLLLIGIVTTMSKIFIIFFFSSKFRLELFLLCTACSFSLCSIQQYTTHNFSICAETF